MFNQTLIELRSLVQHRLQILLAHKGKINSLEELLSAWVYGYRLLQFLESWEVFHYDFVRCLYQGVLVCNTFEIFVEFIFYASEDVFFRFLTLMNEHQIVNDVDVGEVLNRFSHDVLLFGLGSFNVIKSLFKS